MAPSIIFCFKSYIINVEYYQEYLLIVGDTHE